MDEVKWRRLEAIYHEALTRESGERAVYVADACKGDKELEREVTSLLRQNISNSAFLDHPAEEALETHPSPAPREVHDSLVGQTLLQYRILERLGAGGMGVVYKAEDAVLRRTVALKFVSDDALGESEIRARLIREAQAAAALDHPNICSVHGIHEVEGRTFVAMAFVDGPSLADTIKRGPLQLDEALRISSEIAAGLQEAHQHGVVHRDIKPQNIMLTSHGQVKLMDFGLAHVSGRSKLTQTGVAMGTPAYMSPEQVLGEAVDHRADIWALGCVLYEMLTQQTPFEAEYPQAIAYGIVNDDPEPLTRRRPDLPPAIDAIVAKALAKEVENRYARVGELSRDLHHLCADPIGAVSNISAPVRMPALRPLRISRRSAVAAFVATGAAAAGIELYSWLERSTTIDSLAILPFEFEGDPVDIGYLADGIPEGLIVDLARASGLRVISRDISFRYPSSGADARTIGADLGVGAVLRGRLSHQGNLLVISAEIIDAVDGSVLWAERFRRPMSSLVDLGTEMASSIAARLELTYEDRPFIPAGPATESAEAYRLYLLGRYHWSRRGDSLLTSRDYFQRAVDADPSYAFAWAGLADAYLMLAGWSVLAPDESQPRAASAARRTIELDRSLAEPHATLGYFNVLYQRDWPQARNEFEQAISLAPNYATAHHWYAFYHLTVGDVEGALQEIHKARELDPLSPVINIELGYFLLFARRYEEAEAAVREALELDDTIGYPYSILGRALSMQGRDAESRVAHAESLSRGGVSINSWHSFGITLAHLGDLDGAAAMCAKIEDAAKTSYVSPQLSAMIRAVMLENDRAFELLDAAVQDRSLVASWLRDPALDTFAQDPRFLELMNRIDLRA